MRFKKKFRSSKGWDITFRSNVHMYCHHLEATKSSKRFEVPCEDTPEGFIGIWFMPVEIENEIREDLIPALAEFFEGLGSPFKIHNLDGEVVAKLETSTS
ncbi:MAG: hypothetical protein P1U68_15155 [Verrucomicrobiales bacterium]|nr:hypothetical protein [Verrucomicrobiales bacterium]